jgi:hypothetical protein
LLTILQEPAVSLRMLSILALVLIGAVPGCGRARQQAVAPLGLDATTRVEKVEPAATSAQPSEHIATNKPEPACSDCKRGDASNGPLYYGKPDMPLDEKTLAEVSDSVDATCQILEDGLAILEKDVQDPEKATEHLGEYRKKHEQAMKVVFEKAKEIKARLKGAGYDQDIPVEVRPHFDERMSKIHHRLEAMRDVYRKYPAVLEAFGQFFPRGP